MANTMKLQIITPMRTILDVEVEGVILSTTEGEMGVLYDHEPVVTLLGYKDVVYTQGGQKKKATALGGFAEKRLASKDGGIDHARAEIALRKAIARINLSERR